MKCGECGSELVIESGEWVCSSCGLVHQPEMRLDYSDHHYPLVRVFLPNGEKSREIDRYFYLARQRGIKYSTEKLRRIIEFLVESSGGAEPRKPLGISWRDINRVREVLKDVLKTRRITPEARLAIAMRRLGIEEYFSHAVKILECIKNRTDRVRVAGAIAVINKLYRLGISERRICHVCDVSPASIHSALMTMDDSPLLKRWC